MTRVDSAVISLSQDMDKWEFNHQLNACYICTGTLMMSCLADNLLIQRT
jgi:hypothetical protein